MPQAPRSLIYFPKPSKRSYRKSSVPAKVISITRKPLRGGVR